MSKGQGPNGDKATGGGDFRYQDSLGAHDHVSGISQSSIEHLGATNGPSLPGEAETERVNAPGRRRRHLVAASVGAAVVVTGAFVVPSALAERAEESTPPGESAGLVEDRAPGLLEIGDIEDVTETISYVDVADVFANTGIDPSLIAGSIVDNLTLDHLTGNGVLDGNSLDTNLTESYEGESDAAALDLADVLEAPNLVFHQSDASYVKVHFQEMELLGDDYVTVSSPDGEEKYVMDSSNVDNWAMSITGDTAIVELHPRTGLADVTDSLDQMGVVVDQVAYGLPESVIGDRMQQMGREHIEESICGGDDKAPAVCYQESHPEAFASTEPVARLLLDGTVLCTAFRVSEDNRLLTNNHCFTQTSEAQRAELWFDYHCVSCGSRATTQPVKVRGEQVIATNRSLDYTLFTVDDFEAVEHFGHLRLSDQRASQGDEIYIPQHPAGRPSELAITSIPDNGNCVVSHAVYDGYVAGTDIAYMCDTEFGSSGSPVLNAHTHEVVALHHFGGCPNSGVSADQILAEIKDWI
ncbi:trypsin-like serine peptidase [Natronoglycomyces albus]|nr:serine protease [Natronoglycomyces albus]